MENNLLAIIEAEKPTAIDYSRIESAHLIKLIQLAKKLERVAEFAEIEAIHRLQSGDEIPGAEVKFGLIRRSWTKSKDENEIAAELVKLGVSDPWQVKKTLRPITEIDKEIGQNKYGDLIECSQNKHSLIIK